MLRKVWAEDKRLYLPVQSNNNKSGSGEEAIFCLLSVRQPQGWARNGKCSLTMLQS